ncbi:hypothetical protein FACS1894211_03450 [Clostridia bacterium]|nr:hypothetical protein FACS1894211_03450 [Clostridia bacterium]
MTKIKITGDSAWDMPLECQGDFVTTPLSVILDDKEYLDGVNVTNDDIFAYYKRTKRTPKTAAIPPAYYEEVFRRELQTADGIVHISLSSHLSACHGNAKLAAACFQNVHIVDGLSLSSGLAALGLYAYDLAEAGLSAAEIAAGVEAARSRVQCSFVVNELEFLHKGGRCSGLARFAASLLKIRPTILMNGSMSVGKKYAGGAFKTAVARFTDDVFARHPDPDLKRLFITYSTAAPDVVETVRERIAKKFTFEHVYIGHTGCTITSHCGENTLGIGFLDR